PRLCPRLADRQVAVAAQGRRSQPRRLNNQRVRPVHRCRARQPIKEQGKMPRSSVGRLGATGLLASASAAAIALALSVGGASAQECTEKTIDLGEGRSMTGGCEPLKIAFLTSATNNVYLQAGIK